MFCWFYGNIMLPRLHHYWKKKKVLLKKTNSIVHFNHPFIRQWVFFISPCRLKFQVNYFLLPYTGTDKNRSQQQKNWIIIILKNINLKVCESAFNMRDTPYVWRMWQSCCISQAREVFSKILWRVFSLYNKNRSSVQSKLSVYLK